MSDIDRQLAAFIEGDISQDDLRQGLSDAMSSGSSIADMTELLKAAYRQGQLSQVSYESLRSGLTDADDQATRIGSVGDVADDPTITSTPPDRGNYDSTEIIDPPPGASPTSPITGSAEPFSESSLPGLDFELPSEVSSGTGSNWSRPDEWRATELGPIEQGTLIKNRFLIESQLGRGGMGVVFKARDLRKEEARDSDPFVAIKVLSDEFRNHPHALISLQREATKAQKLAHPNVITVYDFDRDGTTIYMTMELMRGESMSDRIRTSGWSGVKPSEAVPMIEQMAAGLAYAHEHDIVHSDFKPGNVFILRDDKVKVIDFGIARAAKRAGVERGDETVFDAGDLSALTPRYASYEMLIGEEPHASDDVYGLAVTAYQLLTGNHPFDLKTAEEALGRDMVPKPIKSLKRRQWKAIERGLQFRRKNRSQNAAEFLKQFRGVSQVRKVLYGTIAALVAVSLFLGYQNTLEQPGPFPEEFRDQFDAHLAFGDEAYDMALAENDLDLLGKSAESFDAAWDIHPKNPGVRERLEDTADEMLDRVDERQLDTAVSNLLCKGNLASYRPVSSACNDLGSDRCETLLNRCAEID